MKKFKQFLRKYKWYRWCEANSVKAHIIFISAIAQSYWIYLLSNPIDEAQAYMFLTVLVASLIKELADTGDTGFSGEDMMVDMLTWLGNAAIQIAITIPFIAAK